MGVIIRINCQHYGESSKCNHPGRPGLINFRSPFNFKKTVKIGKRQCIELYSSKECKNAKRYPRPEIRPIGQIPKSLKAPRLREVLY